MVQTKFKTESKILELEVEKKITAYGSGAHIVMPKELVDRSVKVKLLKEEVKNESRN